MFQEGKLKAGDEKAIIEFSEKYVVSEKLVADYIAGFQSHAIQNRSK